MGSFCCKTNPVFSGIRLSKIIYLAAFFFGALEIFFPSSSCFSRCNFKKSCIVFSIAAISRSFSWRTWDLCTIIRLQKETKTANHPFESSNDWCQKNSVRRKKEHSTERKYSIVPYMFYYRLSFLYYSSSLRQRVSLVTRRTMITFRSDSQSLLVDAFNFQPSTVEIQDCFVCSLSLFPLQMLDLTKDNDANVKPFRKKN